MKKYAILSINNEILATKISAVLDSNYLNMQVDLAPGRKSYIGRIIDFYHGRISYFRKCIIDLKVFLRPVLVEFYRTFIAPNKQLNQWVKSFWFRRRAIRPVASSSKSASNLPKNKKVEVKLDELFKSSSLRNGKDVVIIAVNPMDLSLYTISGYDYVKTIVILDNFGVYCVFRSSEFQKSKTITFDRSLKDYVNEFDNYAWHLSSDELVSFAKTRVDKKITIIVDRFDNNELQTIYGSLLLELLHRFGFRNITFLTVLGASSPSTSDGVVIQNISELVNEGFELCMLSIMESSAVFDFSAQKILSINKILNRLGVPYWKFDSAQLSSTAPFLLRITSEICVILRESDFQDFQKVNHLRSHESFAWAIELKSYLASLE